MQRTDSLHLLQFGWGDTLLASYGGSAASVRASDPLPFVRNAFLQSPEPLFGVDITIGSGGVAQSPTSVAAGPPPEPDISQAGLRIPGLPEIPTIPSLADLNELFRKIIVNGAFILLGLVLITVALIVLTPKSVKKEIINVTKTAATKGRA